MESSDKDIRPILFVLLGPTGVGKTKVAIKVARHLGVPVINADSRQIFAEIPIGTAAPTKQEQSEVKHYFVGSHHLDDYYSAASYEDDVMSLLPQLFADHALYGGTRLSIPRALLSGGSMMYIDAVCKGIDNIPTVDDDTRTEMKRRLAEEGLPALVDELKGLDPEYWEIVDRNNPRRVVHALEICHMTGRTYTSFRTNSAKQRPFRIVKIGLNRPREEMYDRINKRVLQMVDEGLIDEALRVYPKRDLNALNTVGFKEMFDYLDGLITLDEAIRQIQSNTRRYMRKQITWFKKDETVRWFNPNEKESLIGYIDTCLKTVH